tara:strand:+ start:997 stop:1683 length:687 start_codon:yes stop_codon:yes gene_type:complete
MYYNIHGHLIRDKIYNLNDKIPLSRKYATNELKKLNNIENFNSLNEKDKLHSDDCYSHHDLANCVSHGCEWNYYNERCSNSYSSENKINEHFEHLAGNGLDVSCKGGSSCTGVSKDDCNNFKNKGCTWNNVTSTCHGHVNLCEGGAEWCSSNSTEKACADASCTWSGDSCFGKSKDQCGKMGSCTSTPEFGVVGGECTKKKQNQCTWSKADTTQGTDGTCLSDSGVCM